MPKPKLDLMLYLHTTQSNKTHGLMDIHAWNDCFSQWLVCNMNIVKCDKKEHSPRTRIKMPSFATSFAALLTLPLLVLCGS
jgi:hypothetical protein